MVLFGLFSAEPVAETGGEDQEDLENLRFNLNIESLGLVLYSNDPKQVSPQTAAEALILVPLSGCWT